MEPVTPVSRTATGDDARSDREVTGSSKRKGLRTAGGQLTADCARKVARGVAINDPRACCCQTSAKGLTKMAGDVDELEKVVWATAFANAYFWNMSIDALKLPDEEERLRLVRSYSCGHARAAVLAFREAVSEFGMAKLLPEREGSEAEGPWLQ